LTTLLNLTGSGVKERRSGGEGCGESETERARKGQSERERESERAGERGELLVGWGRRCGGGAAAAEEANVARKSE
jgi:hypothetical protein